MASEELLLNGGVNLFDSPLKMRPDQLRYGQNLFIDKDGDLKKRPGVGFIQQAAGGTGAGTTCYKPLNIHIPELSLGYNYLAHFFKDTAGVVSEHIVASNLSSRTDTLESQGPLLTLTAAQEHKPSTDPACFINYRLHTIVAGTPKMEGVHHLHPRIKAFYNASFVHPAAFGGVPDEQTQAIPVRPKVACVFKNRVVYANFGPGMSNWLVFADRFKENHTDDTLYPIFTVVGSDVLSLNGRHVELEGLAGQNIVGMFEIQLQNTGNPISAALVILTAEGGCAICTGEISDTSETDPTLILGDFEPNYVQYKVGCASFNTIKKTDYGYIWASDTDVWMINGNLPVKIGTFISPALTNCPPEAKKWWTAGVIKNHYILQTVPARGSDDRYLQRNQWWLSLDAGIPQTFRDAKWSGPMVVARDIINEDYTAGCALSGIQTDYDGERVIGLCSNLHYLGGSNHRLSLVDYTGSTSTDDITFDTVTSGLEWTPATDYAEFDVVRQTLFANKGRLFYCSTPGTSDVAEPVWNNTSSGTTNDGTVVWTEIQASPVYRMLNKEADDESMLNGFDLRTKDFTFKYPGVDKILERIELFASVGLPALLWADVIRNKGEGVSGDGPKWLLASYGQKRTFDIGVESLDSTNISDGVTETRSLRPPILSKVRGKALQFRLRDGFDNILHPGTDFRHGGYLVDETCNKIVFGVVRAGTNEVRMYQAELTLSSLGFHWYASATALVIDIVAEMNAVVQSDLLGLTTGGTWTGSAAGETFPYMANLRYGPTTRTAGTFLALFHGAEDDYDLSANAIFNNPTTAFDLRASRKLLALLGFNTSTNNSILGPNNLQSLIGSAPDDIYFIPEGDAATPGAFLEIPIYAQQIIQYNRTANWELYYGTVLAEMTSNLPLMRKSR